MRGRLFSSGDIVMLCEHLYHASSCKVSIKIDALSAYKRRWGSPRRVNRNDGTTLLAIGAVICSDCFARDPESRDTNLVECRFEDGQQFLVADLLAAGGPR